MRLPLNIETLDALPLDCRTLAYLNTALTPLVFVSAERPDMRHNASETFAHSVIKALDALDALAEDVA
jgi:hypothetical protein